MTNDNTTNYNSIADYYRAISTIPLLTPTQERRLAQKIQEARLEEEKVPLEQRDPDVSILQTGKIARQHFIRANLRLVVNVVNQHFASTQLLQSMTKMDLIDAGNIGLITAVDTFNAGLQGKFSSYATVVIKNAILAAIYNEDRIIRLPQYKEKQVRQSSVAGTRENLVDSADILFVLSIDRAVDRSPETTDKEAAMEATLATNPIEQVITHLDRQALAKLLLAVLNPREREIALELFVHGRTDTQVAGNLGVSKMRIGQLKRAIQEKLKKELNRRHIPLSDVFDLFE